VLLKLGFREEEALAMSRGKVRSYDQAYDELVNPDGPKKMKVKRKPKKK
jgi:hypothetical protein